MFCIGTWNVNSIRARINLVLKWLKERNPDVLMLQELKCTEGEFPYQEISNIGYNCKVVGQKSWNGVAVISKHPIDVVQNHLNDEARYLEVCIQNYHMCCVYIPQGRDVEHPYFQYKELFCMDLFKRIQEIHNENLILAGDFNIAPYDNDVFNHQNYVNQIPCHPKERLWMRNLVDTGLIDVFALHKNDESPEIKNPYTWWHYRNNLRDNGRRGMRLDHFLVTKNIYEKIQTKDVDRYVRAWPRPSDHAPVWIQIAS